jgi:hypothetical protein
MKKSMFLFGALFAVGLSFTACSSDNDVAENNGPIDNGESYVSFSICLPSASSTRGVNDTFDDGLPAEYQVNDATLVLFRGTDAASATALSAYDLSSIWSTSADAQITTTSKVVTPINSSDKPTGSDELFAYVILNKPSSFTIDGSVLKIGGTAISGTFSTCFGTTNTLTTAALLSTPFVMTNAPLANNPGGASAPTDATYISLVQIDKNKIYSTRELAATSGNEAATINVERNVAKVTIGTAVEESNRKVKKVGDLSTNIKDANNQDVSWAISGWTLSNVAPTTYFQHQVANIGEWYNLHSGDVSTNPYRFVGSSAVTSKYRIYWGESYEYTNNSTLLFASPTEASTASSTPLYCYENNFPVSKQKENYTTRAIIKLAINGGKTFYSMNGAYYGNASGEDAPLKAAIANIIKNDPTVSAALASAGLTADDSKATMTLTASSGIVTISDVVLKNSDESKTYNVSTSAASVVSNFNSNHTIKVYTDGISYYSVLIKHFGDELTPWNADNHLNTATSYNSSATAPSSESDYQNDKYLGRYSVLRNNWYDINITSVSDLGSPTIPDPGTDWDDNVKSFISVQINILSWAKRTQSADL